MIVVCVLCKQQLAMNSSSCTLACYQVFGEVDLWTYFQVHTASDLAAWCLDRTECLRTYCSNLHLTPKTDRTEWLYCAFTKAV
jgi:hypothetical protein